MRQLHFTRTFLRSKSQHAPAGTPQGRAVVHVLHELEDDLAPLPGPNDRNAIIPPTQRCLARPIPSAGLLVCYVTDGTTVYVLGVKRANE